MLKLKATIKRLYLDWDLKHYIKDHLEEPTGCKATGLSEEIFYAEEECFDAYECDCCDEFASAEEDLGELLRAMKKPGFTEELIRLVRESGRKDSAIYKAADIDKRLFSKIMSDAEYKPSKDTAVALALALRLSFEEMQDFISRAGYTVTHSSKRDLIIEFFFKKKQYRLMELNDALYRFGEKPLGRTK